MTPLLYPPTETAFADNGLGALSDAVGCTVTEERNGPFELTLQYPVTGLHYDQLALRSLILAKPNPTDAPQPFRVYRLTKPLNGLVTAYAQHISYDLSGIPAAPFSAPNAPAALAGLGQNAAAPCPFTFWTDKETAAPFSVDKPASLRSLLGGVGGSILDTYGGEYAFDGFTVRLWAARGADRGVTLRYGKNLTDLSQDESCAAVYTGVYPYWAGPEGALIQLPERTLAAPGSYAFVRILPLDLSSEWQEPPTADQLRQRAEEYMKQNSIGTPQVSLTVSFVQLEQTEEYRGLALLERVSLCDTVGVEFSRLGVSARAKCIKTVYNVLLDRMESVELGDARSNLADTLVQQQAAISQKPSTSAMRAAIDRATALITGNLGGYVVLRSTGGGKEPDEILIMDAPDIESAVKVWRWNQSGLGYSKSGYNGPYGLAMTADGQIVADFITAGTLNAAQVQVVNLIADHVRSAQDGYTMELDASHLSLKSGDKYRAYLWVNQPGGGQLEYGYMKLSQGDVSWPFPGFMGADGRVTTVTPMDIYVGQDNDGDCLGVVRTHTVILDELHLNRYGKISGEYSDSGTAWTSRGITQDTVQNVDGERINVLRLL